MLIKRITWEWKDANKNQSSDKTTGYWYKCRIDRQKGRLIIAKHDLAKSKGKYEVSIRIPVCEELLESIFEKVEQKAQKIETSAQNKTSDRESMVEIIWNDGTQTTHENLFGYPFDLDELVGMLSEIVKQSILTEVV